MEVRKTDAELSASKVTDTKWRGEHHRHETCIQMYVITHMPDHTQTIIWHVD